MNTSYENADNAAPPVMVRYLAVFRRTFAAIDRYTRAGDKDGMILGGYLADKLHNVPAMLWNCTADRWLPPSSFDESLRKLPGSLADEGAPDHIVKDSADIVSYRDSAGELGLETDLSDMVLPPPPKLYEYLTVLYRACLSMRLMRNYGHRPPRSRTVWGELDSLWSLWSPHAGDRAEANGLAAAALVTVPCAIVRWDTFDEGAFLDAAVGNRLLEDVLFRIQQDYVEHNTEKGDM